MITVQEAAARLAAHDRIRVLTHQSPDGDTLGCAGALCLGLRALGKQAQFVCADPVPGKYQSMLAPLTVQTFDPDFVVAVDLADPQLLGTLREQYEFAADLGIDHHGSNSGYAYETLVDDGAAAAAELLTTLIPEMGAKITPEIASCLYTCELIAHVLHALGVPLNRDIANCLYTGLCTDTGCFRYSNTTPRTLRLAADLMEAGADAAAINMQMFEIKTPSRLAIERMALDGLQYAYDGHVAVMRLSLDMIAASGATDSDLDGLAPIPRNIAGVDIGLTVRERAPGDYKVSVRTTESVDASALCRTLGGGGHVRAAGCRLSGSCDDVVQRLLAACAPFVQAEGKA